MPTLTERITNAYNLMQAAMTQRRDTGRTGVHAPHERPTRTHTEAGEVLMADTNPGDGRARELKRYWTKGAGAAKIQWGTPGDFDRCVKQLGEYVRDPEGLCNTYHQAAVGAPPGKGH